MNNFVVVFVEMKAKRVSVIFIKSFKTKSVLKDSVISK